MQINLHRTQFESVLASVSVQYEHFHTILYDPFLSVSVSVSVKTPLLQFISALEEMFLKMVVHHRINIT